MNDRWMREEEDGMGKRLEAMADMIETRLKELGDSIAELKADKDELEVQMALVTVTLCKIVQSVSLTEVRHEAAAALKVIEARSRSHRQGKEPKED